MPAQAPSSQALVRTLSPAARDELHAALRRLQAPPGPASRAMDALGQAAGGAGRVALGWLGTWGTRAATLLPGGEDALRALAERALGAAYDAATTGLPAAGAPRTGPAAAVGSVVASGAAGGALGLAGFLPDATVFTLALMRRIARIAAEEGEDLATDDARQACLQVFGLRSGHGALPDGEAGYFQTRLLLGGTAARLVAEVAGRYGLQLGQKLAAGAVPVAGAAAGAAINALFMAQYDSLARAHFTVRRLEREWGADTVTAASATLA